MITDVAGIEVGHAQDMGTLTGCTVVMARAGAVVGVDVRGSAPGTRETDLCRPGALVERAHAVLLTGGSAFGLAAADGVMRFLWERGIGFETGITPVPIVPGAVLFDLGVGDVAWPDAAMGYAACEAATDGAVAQGCVGAGTGATVGKSLGPERATKSGIGTASVRVGAVTVGALIAVNAFGDVSVPGTGAVLAGARPSAPDDSGHGAPFPGTNTTIGVVATDAVLDSAGVNHLATIAHNGLARTIVPVHTRYDGDTMFALSTGSVVLEGPGASIALDRAVVGAVEQAVLSAVRSAVTMGGLPGLGSSRQGLV